MLPNNAARTRYVSPCARITAPITRNPFRSILLALILLSFCVLGLVLESKRPLLPHQVGTGQDIIRVLFIGNSYTSANNLPGLITELAAHESKRLDAEVIVDGGAMLQTHWTEGKALAAIQRGHWDYVVLQEQSTFGSGVEVNGVVQLGDSGLFHQYVRRFDQAIQTTGAKTVLFLTWARQNAPQTQAYLTWAYTDIATTLHVMVAPVGVAWQRVLTTHPGLALYQSDGSHPNSAGSYLAACVFYATIYGKTPQGLPSHLSSSLVDSSGTLQQGDVNLNPSDALVLQQTAWQIVSQQQPN